MTERKPPGMAFTSWIDQQILDATERGEFDNLPGAGKPIPRRREEADYGQAWLRDYARRQGVAEREMLPTPLKLRKEIEELTDTIQALSSEREVRTVATELNERIMAWRRIPLGPPVFVPLVHAETLVSRWREVHPAEPAPPPVPERPRRTWRSMIMGLRR